MALGEWSVRWLYADPLPAQIDPITLTWWMHRRVESAALPDQRVTIEFDYRHAEPPRIWMVLDRGEPSVCFKHPGFEPDVVVTAEPIDLMRVFSGSTSLSDALGRGQRRPRRDAQAHPAVRHAGSAGARSPCRPSGPAVGAQPASPSAAR